MRQMLDELNQAKSISKKIKGMEEYISKWQGIARWMKYICTSIGGLSFVGGGIITAITGTWYRSSITSVQLPRMEISGLSIDIGGKNLSFTGAISPIISQLNETETGSFQMDGFVIDRDNQRSPLNVTVIPGEIGPDGWVPILEGASNIAFYGGAFLAMFGKFVAHHLLEPTSKIKEKEQKEKKIAQIKEELIIIINKK
jgi:hypothetical protein